MKVINTQQHDLRNRENKAYSSFLYNRSLYAGKRGVLYYLKYFYAFMNKSPL